MCKAPTVIALEGVSPGFECGFYGWRKEKNKAYSVQSNIGTVAVAAVVGNKSFRI